MKLRTVIVLAGLGALAARRATAVRRRPVLLLDPGPPLEPTPPLDAPEAAPAAERAEAPAPAQAVPPLQDVNGREASGRGSAALDPVAAGSAAETEAPAAAEAQTEGRAPEPTPAQDTAPAAPPPGPVAPAESPPTEIDGWPVAAVPALDPVPEPAPLPRVEDVPTGWSVVLYPEQGPVEGSLGETRADTLVLPPAERSPGASRVSGQPPAPVPARTEDGSPAAEIAPVAGARREVPDDLRRLLLGNQVPLVFVAATPFAMLGLERLVGRLSAITLHDCFDGRHGSVYVPRGVAPVAFGSPASVANALLAEREVIDRLRLRPGRIVVLSGDEETERLATSFGYAVALAPSALRTRLEAQAELLRLARDVGLNALPAATGHAGSYQNLLLLARGLGTDLLVASLDRPEQPPVPIGSLEDWSAHERRLGAEQLRVIRRLDGPTYTLAGVVSRSGVVVAPVVADSRHLPGDPPYGGGSFVCDVAPDLEPELLGSLRAATRSLGGRLAEEGFAGVFEVALSLDRRGGPGPALIAISPHASAATMLDTVSALAADELPVLALHLAVHLGASLDGVGDDARVRAPWSFLVVEDASDTRRTVTEAPSSGVWRLDASAHGGIRHVRAGTDWRSLGDEDEDEVFYLRIARSGVVCEPGGSLGVVVAPGRLMVDDGRPAERAQHWVRGVRKNVWTAAAPVSDEATSVPAGLLAL